ncbi:paired amphipathic helix protein Sin3a-like protein [Sarcoptes scabiei]|uniref:Paired amphipathic helix protein Sin3a-like protein n=1 Tax=Sarcoptes scabiei TaxID=52283 RepID=A0A132A4W4_SARSC|nr:paired amphipathic helix protein Sin3a-like protein [Sarcoptes scabiei]
MNTINVTANITSAAPTSATAANIIKPSHQPTIIPQTNIIPATLITTANERLNNNNKCNESSTISNNSKSSISHTQHQNHEQVTQSVTAFTIHAPGAQLPNNLVTAGTAAGPSSQIHTANSNATLIHPATIGITGTSAVASSVVCTTTILPAGSGQQITAIPVGVTGSTVLKAQPTVATIPIGQRFTATNVMNSTGAANASPINALFIHQDPSSAFPSKNTNANHLPTPPPTAHLQQNTVVNSSVTVPTVTLQPISTTHSAPAPLFVQTGNTSTPNSAIFSTNVSNMGHNSQKSNISINLSTSSVQQSQPPSSSCQQQPQFQRLKVEDALSYLDQVKFKFNDKPQVYNDFLDIMKEFKSQSIDTPGVIQRVSNLFKGNPELIVGFNTFLPPGYKIEIHSNDQVNVSMPNSTNVVLMSTNPLSSSHQQQQQSSVAAPIVGGQNIHHQLSSGNLVRGTIVTNQPQIIQTTPSNHQQSSSTFSIQDSTSLSQISVTLPSNVVANPIINTPSRIEPNHRTGHSIIESANSRPIGSIQAPSTTNNLHSQLLATNTQSNTLVPPPSGPVEFNHAINYVNKIKNRFLEQPEIYKQFLDILQSYQKEQDNSGQKILTESEVFSKVSKLFENQPDLLQEFSQFLPDAHNSSSHHHHGSLSAHASANSGIMTGSSSNFNVGNSSQAVSLNFSHSTAVHNSSSTLGNSGNMPTSVDINNYHHHIRNQAANSAQISEHSTLKPKSINVINSSNPVHHSGRSLHSSGSVSTGSSISNPYNNSFQRSNKRSISTNSINTPIDQTNVQHLSIKRSKLIPFRENQNADLGAKNISHQYDGKLREYALFDALRSGLKPIYYEALLRRLILFNNDILTRSELSQFVQPLFSTCPDLYAKFKDILGVKENSQMLNSSSSFHHQWYNLYTNPNAFGSSSYHNNLFGNTSYLDGLGNRYSSPFRDRRDYDYVDLDFSSSKRYGASYRTMPKNTSKQECSGRTPLCQEVLNDTLVSFPSWSEDSTFVSSRKTQYEEYVYRCEDERYELDLVIETNLSTIRVLQTIHKKMEKMTNEERTNFKLDDSLGGTSQVIHLNSIRRIYGDQSPCIIEGIKNCPYNVIPLVLRRLIAKDEEWRDSQKQFNRIWREQNEKYYLKSLDHQSLSFKQNDLKYLRTKSLNNEIENIATSRQKKSEDQESENHNSSPSDTNSLPHMIFVYPDKSMIGIASNLIIHHVKRQTSVHKDDKRKIKHMMRQFIPDLFATPRGDMSDDEIDDDIKTENDNECNSKCEKSELKPSPMLNSNPDEEYSLFFVTNYWYFFFRLHYVLCERLSKMHQRAQQIACEESKTDRESAPANLLRLKNNLGVKAEDYFVNMVDMIKQVLDGNMDSNQFEDNLREMFNIHAYIAFTLDKIVQMIVRQLQHIVSDEISQKCTNLYLESSKIGSAGGLCSTASQRLEQESSYYRNFEQLLSTENRFKVIIYKGEGKITFDLLAHNVASNEESANEGDDDSNVPQSSRTLRSSTKNLSEKEREKILLDDNKIQELLEQKLKSNPPFLNKCILKYKEMTALNRRENKENNRENIESKTVSKEYSDPATPISESRDTNENEESNDSVKSKSSKTFKNEDIADVNEGANNSECKFRLDGFKSVIVVQNETMMYRYRKKDPSDQERQSRMNHEKITRKKFKRFEKWHNDWIRSNCLDTRINKFDQWLLESDTTDFRLESIQNDDDDLEKGDRDVDDGMDTKEKDRDKIDVDIEENVNPTKSETKTEVSNNRSNSTSPLESKDNNNTEIKVEMPYNVKISHDNAETSDLMIELTKRKDNGKEVHLKKSESD